MTIYKVDDYLKEIDEEFEEACLRIKTRRLHAEMQLTSSWPCTEVRYIAKFNLPSPEIELCTIINILKKINEDRINNDPVNKSAVYIDVCDGGKFYVGYSAERYLDNKEDVTAEKMALSRLNSHRQNGGGQFYTNFTYMYPVISCIGYCYGDKVDEDLITLLVSKCVGNNVRGGIWASPYYKLPNCSKISATKIIDVLMSRKYNNQTKQYEPTFDIEYYKSKKLQKYVKNIILNNPINIQ